MRLLLLLVIGGVGAGVAAWGLPRGGRSARIGAVVGVLALVAITGDAFLLRPARLTDTGQPITGIFDAHLVATVYLRLVVGLWGLDEHRPRLRRLAARRPAAAARPPPGDARGDDRRHRRDGVGGPRPRGGGRGGDRPRRASLVILAAEGPSAVAAGARELRVTLVAGAVLLAAFAIVPVAAQARARRDRGAGRTRRRAAGGAAAPVLGLTTIAVGLAVAARWGMLPFHVRVSRLSDLVPPETMPLLLAWVAVPLTVVAFAAVDRLIAPLALPLDGERAVLVALAFLTLVGASLAAFFHDDLRHAVGYLVIADAGLLLLAIAALDPAAWGPGRAWVVALAASKTALGAWAAVAEDRFETRSVPDLRGWIRRSPLLAAGLALTVLATFGVPGWVAFEARRSLATLVADAPWDGAADRGGLPGAADLRPAARRGRRPGDESRGRREAGADRPAPRAGRRRCRWSSRGRTAVAVAASGRRRRLPSRATAARLRRRRRARPTRGPGSRPSSSAAHRRGRVGGGLDGAGRPTARRRPASEPDRAAVGGGPRPGDPRGAHQLRRARPRRRRR